LFEIRLPLEVSTDFRRPRIADPLSLASSVQFSMLSVV